MPAFSKTAPIIIAAVLACAGANAEDAADFYHGKTVTLIVSNATGGGYDLLSRIVAPVLAKNIPGNPAVVVQNMPGAAGILAANHLFSLAEKDGTIIASLANTVPFEPLLGTAQAHFDPLAFNWLGSPTAEVGLLGVWHTVPVNSIADARTREVTIASDGPHSTPSFYAQLVNATLGTKLKIVNGYRGQSDFNLAVESGEIDGISGLFYSSLMGTKPDWLRDKKIKLLLQYGFEKEPMLPDVPFAPDLAQNDDDRNLMQAAFAALGVGRPFAMPPGVPLDRVHVMQDALTATFRDPEFLTRSKALELNAAAAKTGDQLRDIITKAYAVSAETKARLKALYE